MKFRKERALKRIKRSLTTKNLVQILKKVKEICLKADIQVKRFYNKFNSFFIGKILIKLLSEIVLALLIAVFTYQATSFYHSRTAFSEANKKLDQIYISVSDEYVNSLFGIPYVSMRETEELTNNFYIVGDDVILRTVSKNNNVVAFFITATNENRRIPTSAYDDVKPIGEVVYTDSDYGGEYRDAYYSGNGRGNYYYEMQGTGRYGMYNYYLYGTVSYGFLDNRSMELVTTVGLDKDIDQAFVDELRGKVKPNTFGVIADGYQDVVGVIPSCDEWLNIYYLLDNITN